MDVLGGVGCLDSDSVACTHDEVSGLVCMSSLTRQTLKGIVWRRMDRAAAAASVWLECHMHSREKTH